MIAIRTKTRPLCGWRSCKALLPGMQDRFGLIPEKHQIRRKTGRVHQQTIWVRPGDPPPPTPSEIASAMFTPDAIKEAIDLQRRAMDLVRMTSITMRRDPGDRITRRMAETLRTALDNYPKDRAVVSGVIIHGPSAAGRVLLQDALESIESGTSLPDPGMVDLGGMTVLLPRSVDDAHAQHLAATMRTQIEAMARIPAADQAMFHDNAVEVYCGVDIDVDALAAYKNGRIWLNWAVPDHYRSPDLLIEAASRASLVHELGHARDDLDRGGSARVLATVARSCGTGDQWKDSPREIYAELYRYAVADREPPASAVSLDDVDLAAMHREFGTTPHPADKAAIAERTRESDGSLASREAAAYRRAGLSMRRMPEVRRTMRVMKQAAGGKGEIWDYLDAAIAAVKGGAN